MAAHDWKSINKNFEFHPEYHNNKYNTKFDFYSMLEIMPSVIKAESLLPFTLTRAARNNISRLYKHSRSGS
jgi:hypothetical protein